MTTLGLWGSGWSQFGVLFPAEFSSVAVGEFSGDFGRFSCDFGRQWVMVVRVAFRWYPLLIKCYIIHAGGHGVQRPPHDAETWVM